METLNASGMEEMLTLYSVDGNGISLLHYCPTNNQPHMRAIPSLGHVNQLIFSFIVGRTITAGFKRRELPQDTRKESNPHFAKDTVRGPARASDCIPVRPGGTPPNARRQEESTAPAD
jgi:hypothetical protein